MQWNKNILIGTQGSVFPKMSSPHITRALTRIESCVFSSQSLRSFPSTEPPLLSTIQMLFQVSSEGDPVGVFTKEFPCIQHHARGTQFFQAAGIIIPTLKWNKQTSQQNLQLKKISWSWLPEGAGIQSKENQRQVYQILTVWREKTILPKVQKVVRKRRQIQN